MHEQAPSAADLSAAIERPPPTSLPWNSPADPKDKVEQKNKRGIRSVYPLLGVTNWATVALEPKGPRRTELIGLLGGAEQELQKTSPQKDEAFDTYNDTLFKYLLAEWHSGADVNAAWTDRLFAVKHSFQHSLYGPQEEQGWEGWNQYFLQQIETAAKQNPGKRIVVIVGVEHGYWLREHLRTQEDVRLLDTAGLLQH
jgi:hypothetical protein